MKIKQLIKLLKEFDGELEVFYDSLSEVRPIDGAKKIKVMTDKREMSYSPSFGVFKTFKVKRYNKKHLTANTKLRF